MTYKIRNNSAYIESQWAAFGHLYAILSPNEKRGKTSYDEYSMDFICCMGNCGLLDAGYSDINYTWTNGKKRGNKICKVFDTVLYNEEWIDTMGDTMIQHM